MAFDAIAFVFGVYFALMWAVVLYFMLMPKLAVVPIVKVSLFTVVVGISLVLILQRLPSLSACRTDARVSAITRSSS